MRKVFIIRHIGEERLGSFREVLETGDYEFRYLEAPHEDLSLIDPLEPDFLFVMGGPIGVYDSENYPFLRDELKILETRMAADKPTLGVCLGAQLMAHALGSKVYKGSNGLEVGWHPLKINENGQKTALKYLDTAHTNMFHWHGDTFDLPQGATLLASSEKYPHQAYSFGKNILGLQCHPEVSERMLREWFITFVHDVTGPKAVADLSELRSETIKNVPIMKVQAQKFLREWMESREF